MQNFKHKPCSRCLKKFNHVCLEISEQTCPYERTHSERVKSLHFEYLEFKKLEMINVCKTAIEEKFYSLGIEILDIITSYYNETYYIEVFLNNAIFTYTSKLNVYFWPYRTIIEEIDIFEKNSWDTSLKLSDVTHKISNRDFKFKDCLDLYMNHSKYIKRFFIK